MQPISAKLRNILQAILLLSSISLFNSCGKKDHPSPGNQTAKGSLQAENGGCLPGTVHGTWYAGVIPGSDSNYVDVSVNVTRTGSYTVVTDLVNGVKFSGSGSFTSTGLQTVRLTTNGKFNTTGIVNFTTSFDGSACGFSVNADVPPITNNTWRATIGGRVYWGSATSFVTGYTLDETFDFIGTLASNPDTTVALHVRMPLTNNAERVTFGTYRSSFVGARFLMQVKGVTYLHAQGPGPGIMVMMINKEDHVDGMTFYEGTFSGTVKDDAGNITEITDGVFRAGTN